MSPLDVSLDTQRSSSAASPADASAADLLTLRQRLSALEAELIALRHQAHLQEDLINLTVEDRGLDALVDRLSVAVGNPVALSDQLFHLLACAPREEHGDRHRREAVAAGGTPRHVLDDPQAGAYFREVAEKRQPVLFPSLPAYGMDQRRLMAPIQAGGEIIGYVTVLEERPFGDELSGLLEQAAKVLALELMKRRVALETELHLMTDFLGDLLNSRSANRDAIVRRAGFLGVDLFRDWVILLIEADDSAALCTAARAHNPVSAHQRLFEVIRRRVRQHPPGGIVVVQGDSIVVLYPASGARKDGPATIARDIRREVARSFPGASVSVAISGVCQSLESFPIRFSEARRALDAVHGLRRHNQTVTLEELGLYGLLFRRDDPDELVRYAERLLGPLVSYDARRGTHLLKTLDVYLGNGGAFRETARQLGIHLNTLRGRLERICDLCSADLKDARTRLDFQIALEIARISHADGQAYRREPSLSRAPISATNVHS